MKISKDNPDVVTRRTDNPMAKKKKKKKNLSNAMQKIIDCAT